MSAYEKQIDRIRDQLNEKKGRNYPVKNDLLRKKDEYVKCLYFKMLCTLIHYMGEPGEMQVLYMNRLIAGCNAKSSFKEYMKMAMQLELGDVERFVAVFKTDPLKYYFCIDGVILLSIEKTDDKSYELLAELMEILEIAYEELHCVVMIAKSVITRNSEFYDVAKKMMSETMKKLSFMSHISDFYVGAVTESVEKIYIRAPQQEQVDLSVYKVIRSRKVLIENVFISLDTEVVFEGCEEVILRKCRIEGEHCCFRFEHVGTVVVEDCRVRQFKNRFAVMKYVNKIIVRENVFSECGYTAKNYCGQAVGGVFLCDKGNVDLINIEGNQVLNCYVARNEYLSCQASTDIFLKCTGKVQQISVKNNSFIGGRCINNDEKWAADAYIYVLSQKITERNNVCSGSVKNVFS